MKILVVAAMPNELNAIKSWIKSAGIKAKLDINYLCLWVWWYESISALEQYLTKNPEPIFIWNIWICGYWNPTHEIKSDPVQFATVMNILLEKELIIPVFAQIAPLKNGFSSETIVYEKPEFSKKIWTANNEMYFDMEWRWVEFVALRHKFPSIILKVPFDFIWENNQLKFTKDTSEQIHNSLKDLPYHDYLGKILKWINEQK